MTDSSASARSLVDTNIVVYAYDPAEVSRHRAAIELLRRLSGEKRLVFSAQVFNEFCSVMMHTKRAKPFSPAEASQTLRQLAATGEIVAITSEMTFLALDAIPRHGLSFWDALIWAAAKGNDVEVIHTEDFQDGRDVEGVRFINPFLASP
jgi:predicted nucleic acid-binding protein